MKAPFNYHAIMMKFDQKVPYLLLLAVLLMDVSSSAQQMITKTYRDTTLPYLELDPSRYGFDYPICSDVLTLPSFDPPGDGVYFKSPYGHRYLSSTSAKSDNHGGFDYWADITCNGSTYNSTNPIAINSMCDGVISDVINGPDSVLELTPTGRSVQVTCDSSYQTLGSSIVINYRHLSSLGALATMAELAAPNTVRIQKGEVIGTMGESGTTSNVHLHLSTQTNHPEYGNAFVNTARLFDPNLHPNVLAPLREARIELLHDWPDSALFRIIWPFNQTISRFEFNNNGYQAVFDKEAAYDTGSQLRDRHDCIEGFKVFAYQFNGKQTAFSRYENEKNNMPAIYPASPQRDQDLPTYNYAHIPITHDSIAFVYDFIIEDLPPSHDKELFTVKLSDVWGHTVEGSFPTPVGTEEQEGSRLEVFPNPGHGQITLRFSEKGTKQIEVFDPYGRLILHVETQQDQKLINVSEWKSGFYFLRITSAHGVVTSNLLKM